MMIEKWETAIDSEDCVSVLFRKEVLPQRFHRAL